MATGSLLNQLNNEDTNIFIVDVVEDYLKDKPRYSPVYEERIVIE